VGWKIKGKVKFFLPPNATSFFSRNHSPQVAFARKMGQKTPLSFEAFREIVETRSRDIVANVAICLIHQANYLLDRQSLEKGFLEKDGLTERMTKARIDYRNAKRRQGR